MLEPGESPKFCAWTWEIPEILFMDRGNPL